MFPVWIDFEMSFSLVALSSELITDENGVERFQMKSVLLQKTERTILSVVQEGKDELETRVSHILREECTTSTARAGQQVPSDGALVIPTEFEGALHVESKKKPRRDNSKIINIISVVSGAIGIGLLTAAIYLLRRDGKLKSL